MFERRVVVNVYKNEVCSACYNDNNNNNNNLYKQRRVYTEYTHNDGLMRRGRLLRVHSINLTLSPVEHTPPGLFSPRRIPSLGPRYFGGHVSFPDDRTRRAHNVAT